MGKMKKKRIEAANLAIEVIRACTTGGHHHKPMPSGNYWILMLSTGQRTDAFHAAHSDFVLFVACIWISDGLRLSGQGRSLWVKREVMPKTTCQQG